MADQYAPYDHQLPTTTSATYPSLHADSLPHPSSLFPPPFLRQNSSYSSSDSSGAHTGSSGQVSDVYSATTVYDLSPQQQSQQQYATSQAYPTSSVPATSGTAAHLLQQHQANQQAFRDDSAARARMFQPSPSGDSYGSNSAPGSVEPSREGSVSSGGSGRQQNGDDGDFTQSFYDPFRVKHRRRTSPPQLKVLEYHFDRNPKPDVTLRKALSEQLDMTPREVQVWFQNRRAKVKKLREKAEREAAAMAAEGGDPASLNAYASSSNPLMAPASELPIPPAFPPNGTFGRTIYGQDALALRRGSSPAVFGAGQLPQPPPVFEAPFQPYPTSTPFQPATQVPQNQSMLAFSSPFNAGLGAYPSPAATQGATPSPNEFLPHHDMPTAPPVGVPSYLAGEVDQVGHVHARRFSLPVYNNLYAPPPSDIPASQPLAIPPAAHYSHHAPISLPPAHVPQPHGAYPASAPVESSYLDGLAPPLPAQIDALSLGVEAPALVGVDGHSPASSLGDPALSWDGHSQPAFALDGVPADLHRASYAPPVPSQLSRRASCPDGPAAYGASFDPYGAQQQQQQHLQQVAPSWPEADLAPVQAVPSAGPFYGYSMTTSPALSAGPPTTLSPHASPLPAHAQQPSYSRRGSLAAPPPLSLGTIAEQPPVFDPSAAFAALQQQQQAQQQQGQSPSPPGSGGLSERRGSVIRKQRSTHGSLHSPYAAAAQDRHGASGGEGGMAGAGL
ncbi:hypothetical protein JCM8097_004784 [Rhodosporidiobolus ruineniae]